MMKKSRRAKRIQRHYRRMHLAGKLNLVSLMDIFTILVFFLMVNSSDVKVLQPGSQVSLPESSADQALAEVLTIEVAGSTVLVQGRAVARLDQRSADGTTIPGLARELEQQLLRRGGQPIPDGGLPINLMGDRLLPYQALRAVMKTSVEAGFGKVRLAVEQKAQEAPRG